MFEYKQVGQRLQLVAFEHFRALSACAALRLGLSIAAPYALELRYAAASDIRAADLFVFSRRSLGGVPTADADGPGPGGWIVPEVVAAPLRWRDLRWRDR